ncbi:hypothetical protein BHE74_00050269 [Ensete ventricosum]|nr:hypothetical protein GW17_00021417 [Ensete ventricosum]RWW44036.1 hypothetical protein BHE74_00050269 [Ensete ventricosum]
MFQLDLIAVQCPLSDNLGEDCPVFENLFEFCQLYAGGTIVANKTLSKLINFVACRNSRKRVYQVLCTRLYFKNSEWQYGRCFSCISHGYSPLLICSVYFAEQENLNSKSYLSTIKVQVLESLRCIQHAPGVQMQEVSLSFLSLYNSVASQVILC